MKINKFLLGAFALSMGFASCSNDEPANGGNNNGTVEGSQYMAVRIQTAGMGGSRAFDGFEEGLDREGEVTVTNTRFYFFDEKGNAFSMEAATNVNGTVASNMVAPQSVNPGNTDGNAPVAKEAVLILGKAVGQGFQGVIPARALCVVGLADADFTKLQNKSLSSLKSELSNYDATSFVMTSSNYKGANDLGATDIADKIAPNPTAAAQNPADFWVERLAVKVRMSQAPNEGLRRVVSLDKAGNEATYTIYAADGSKQDVKLSVNLTDWQLIKTASTSFLFKNLPTVEPTWSWNDAPYHRSYWSETPAAAELENKTFDILSNDGWLNNAANAYANEYTKGAAASLNDRNGTTTAVAIRGYVQIEKEEGKWENIDLVKWTTSYYELGTFKYMVANTYNATATTAITPEDVKLVKDGTTNTYKVQINGEDFAYYKEILFWDNGASSFYLNIKHTDNGETPVYGVVRNHIYEYALDKVIGLGVPGNDPTIPQDKETFVSARLNILNWHVVKNNVTLE